MAKQPSTEVVVARSGNYVQIWKMISMLRTEQIKHSSTGRMTTNRIDLTVEKNSKEKREELRD